MMNINGKIYQIEFRREPVPVTFFQRSRQITQNRMSTTAILVAADGEVIDTATVRPHHQDQYNRKRANEAAVLKLADQSAPDTGNQILWGFFSKWDKPTHCI